jgi:hypothetical protein
MQLAIFADPQSWYYRDLERAAAARGHQVRRLDFPEIRGSPPGRPRSPKRMP